MSAETDTYLLRRFEPVLRFTRGEQFFPMAIEPYVQLCSLWARRPGEEASYIVPQGEMNVERLAQRYPDKFGTVQYLKLTDPLSPPKLASYYLNKIRSSKDTRDTFHAGRGRLARVGYISRFIDALFTISLLARGRVPGDTAAAATITYKRIMAEKRPYCYYGRVVRESGWIVLQYWFFYLFDDWRSGFFGANDHEADWEMVAVYLYESDSGEVKPEWVAYAAHDQFGDDIRRRWDDPELEKVGEHPMVYIGAGSHASYFRPGEYMTEVVLPFLVPFAKIADRLQRFWHEQLKQYAGEETQAERGERGKFFRVAFVDYARGDGVAIGPSQAEEWDGPRLLSPPPSWVTSYRGLWGFYAHDPFEGEDAPAGPMYNRDGTVRSKWCDPAGWAGLEKVSPPNEVVDAVRRRLAEVRERQVAATAAIEERSRELHCLGVEARSMQGHPQLGKLYQSYIQRIDALSKELDELRVQLASDQIQVGLMESYAERLRTGEREPPRAHIQHANEPASDAELRSSRLLEIWAAASVGLMLIGFVAVVIFARQYLIHWLVLIVSLFVVIEATFRGRLTRLVTGVTIGLAVVAGLVLAYEFAALIAIVAVLAAGLYILFENLRELWS